MSTTTDSTGYYLYDYETADKIGPATAAQVEASLAAGDTGVICIDEDGDVVSDDDVYALGRRDVYVA